MHGQGSKFLPLPIIFFAFYESRGTLNSVADSMSNSLVRFNKPNHTGSSNFSFTGMFTRVVLLYLTQTPVSFPALRHSVNEI